MDHDGGTHHLLTHREPQLPNNTHQNKRNYCTTPDRNQQATLSPPHKRRDQRRTPTKVTSNTQHRECNTSVTEQQPTNTRDLSKIQSKYPKQFVGLVLPRGAALDHPAAPMLLEFATHGCKAGIDTQWTTEMIEAAITRGAHPSALQPEPAKQLREETLEKVAQGYARLIPWDSIKQSPPQNLKISPIAAIPHKSRGYRMILDLSHGVSIGTTKYASVNECTSEEVAPNHAMAELGRVLPRLIYAVATAPEQKGPILFSKLDIKDGYWRMVVTPDDEWNFAYVLPKLQPNEPTQLVVPSCLQMGWCRSASYFCAASETARDVSQSLAEQRPGFLPEHPLETFLLPPTHQLANPESTAAWDFLHLIEVYIDDFIQLAQCTDPTKLLHISRAILHGIHSIFPPPTITGGNEEDPIAFKKLQQGDGIWDTRKEILGWIFDGIQRCIELPPDKHKRIQSELRTLKRRNKAPRKDLERLLGRLRHACIGMPAGRGLLGPIDAALRNDRKWLPIKSNETLRSALSDFGILLHIVTARPTHCRELVTNNTPGFIGFCDASAHGAGGVWFAGEQPLHPTVWRVPWPPIIQTRLVTFHNPDGTISNSDLEMAGMLLHYLVLEQLAPLRHIHVAAWCDNTPTVSWTNKLSASRSPIAGRLTRALAMRIHVNQASPLTSLSIAGVDNTMADTASRTFHRNTATNTTFAINDDEFLLTFNSSFPLQDHSWQGFRLSSKITSRVFSELKGEASTLASWRRLTRKGSAIGTIGDCSSHRSVMWTPCLQTSPPTSASNSSPPLPNTSALVPAAKATKYALAPSKSRSAPSARPSSWTDSQTHCTAPKDGTGSNLNDKSKGSDDTTPQPSTN